METEVYYLMRFLEKPVLHAHIEFLNDVYHNYTPAQFQLPEQGCITDETRARLSAMCREFVRRLRPLTFEEYIRTHPIQQITELAFEVDIKVP